MKSESVRDCDKDDDGLQATFLGLPQRKNKRIVGDDYSRLPGSLLINPQNYRPGLVRFIMTFLAIVQRILVFAVGLTLSIAVMVGMFWTLKLLGELSEWLLGLM